MLIPPSVLLAIYAIVAEQSLPKLYAAAFVPGFVLAGLYVLAVWVVALAAAALGAEGARHAARRARCAPRSACGSSAVLFFFAVFGIYLGWFSPTEAAAVAAFVAILIAFATRADGLARAWSEALLETVYTTAAIFFIVVGAFIFSRFIVLTQFPNELARVGEAGRARPVLDPARGDRALPRCSAPSSTR